MLALIIISHWFFKYWLTVKSQNQGFFCIRVGLQSVEPITLARKTHCGFLATNTVLIGAMALGQALGIPSQVQLVVDHCPVRPWVPGAETKELHGSGKTGKVV